MCIFFHICFIISIVRYQIEIHYIKNAIRRTISNMWFRSLTASGSCRPASNALTSRLGSSSITSRSRSICAPAMFNVDKLSRSALELTIAKRCFANRVRVSPDTLTDEIVEDDVMQRNRQAPFMVRRTRSDNIPCYVTLRHNKPVTILRKVHGDRESLIRELEMITEKKVNHVAEGVLEIPGNHKARIKVWLKHLYF